MTGEELARTGEEREIIMNFDLEVLRNIYNSHGNLMEFMREVGNSGDTNSIETIMLSYDFQAGTYVDRYDREKSAEFYKWFSEIIVEKDIRGSLLDAGVGEATGLITLLELCGLLRRFPEVYAFDASWSRIKVAKQFSFEHDQNNIRFSTGDLLHIPFIDNYFDLVYTSHAIEPNGGKEKAILQELYRVCKKYLILLEPCYDFANEEARKRMLKHGYATRLYEAVKELNYCVERHELYYVYTETNPTGITIIRKNESDATDDEYVSGAPPYACPISKKPIISYRDSYYCPESMLAYPIIQDIPCLLTNNAVVATKY